MTTQFDPANYWEHRHLSLRGDHRNVGNRALSSEENVRRIAQKAALTAYELGKLGLRPGAAVLDAGCGTGVFSSMLAGAGFAMCGQDISSTAIDAARRTECGDFRTAPISSRAFVQRFDAVLCFDVLFHVIDEDEWEASIQALQNSVRAGGWLLLIEYFPEQGAPQAPHCRWRTLEIYQAVFSGMEWVLRRDFRYPGDDTQKTLLVLKRC